MVVMRVSAPASARAAICFIMTLLLSLGSPPFSKLRSWHGGAFACALFLSSVGCGQRHPSSTIFGQQRCRMPLYAVIFTIVFALSANMIPAFAQQASPDPRIADLVQAGKLRVGLFSSQYTKDPTTGELKSVRVDVARALAARMGIPAVLVQHRTPLDVVECLKAGGCDVVF